MHLPSADIERIDFDPKDVIVSRSPVYDDRGKVGSIRRAVVCFDERIEQKDR